VVSGVRLLLNLIKKANTLRQNRFARVHGVCALENLNGLSLAFRSGNEVPCLTQVISEAGRRAWVWGDLLVLLLSLVNCTANSSRQGREK